MALSSASLILAAVVLALFCIAQALRYRRLSNAPGLKEIRGYVTLMANTSSFSSIFYKSTSFFALGQYQFWLKNHRLYPPSGWDICVNLSLWPRVGTSFVIGNSDVYKEIANDPTRFPKPMEDYELLTFFGPNIVASDGRLWKKFRKICAPAFSERNNRLVWEESVNTISAFFEEVWFQDRDEPIVIDNFKDLTLQFTLRVVSAAGFGKRLSWDRRTRSSDSAARLSFEETLHALSNTDIFFKLLLPDWCEAVVPPLKRINRALTELRAYLQEVIDDRRDTSHGTSDTELGDLFSNLLAANEKDDPTNRLDDHEVIGNVFMFLFAAQETSAHTLCWVFALLALYQGEQDELHRAIAGVRTHTIGEVNVPTYDEFTAHKRTLAVVYETLRLFPPNISLPKTSISDTTVLATNSDGRQLVVPIPKGSSIFLHSPGVHYNPRYWPNPNHFSPDRFLRPDWPRHAFVPFGAGTRACLGRRFAEISMVAIINMFVERYHIAIKEEAEFQTETFEERKERITKGLYGITHTPARVPLVFTRRTTGV